MRWDQNVCKFCLKLCYSKNKICRACQRKKLGLNNGAKNPASVIKRRK